MFESVSQSVMCATLFHHHCYIHSNIPRIQLMEQSTFANPGLQLGPDPSENRSGSDHPEYPREGKKPIRIQP